MKQAFDPRIPGTRYQIDGVTLHAIEAGAQDGPLIILLHGFPEFWWGWRYQIGPLADAGFRVLVPDQRGYNLSDKPEGRRAYDLERLARDVVGLADALGREKFSVVGHDWGGLVAWWTASRYPDRVEKLVVLNAPHPAVAGSYMRSHPSQMVRSLYVGFFQIPFLPEAMLSANGHRSLKDALRRTSRPGTFSDEDLARYETAWVQPGAVTAMLNWYRALPFKPDMKDPTVRAPTFVIWGTRDRFLERGLAEASLALCRSGDVRWIETATHWVQHEEPEAVNAAMVEFLKA
ncbi:alpha/beta fold hydrolase [Microvirga lotononidis]|uniref:Putative hydrolase or acyltransferase of alpha/beta superfamily n=1 Tax=Microvirga lotononidis TaxID=864069 RepID=I4YMC5_9HYPH|nr:alpha/beta hydrolase [Microvirga lotononidis]EIM25117.1 putative hydrolase or acyltransferase of alpha/beta superfamily [Microvirga lotononidis]WQO29393.1 alpha/beta hydrolase [Microvirga lotononidis]